MRAKEGVLVILLYILMLETEDERNKMEYVYEKYKPLMLMCAVKILRNKELAEDAVHEAFLSVMKHKKKYLSESCPDLGVPIVIITRNKCLDILKKASHSEERIDDHKHYLESTVKPLDDQIALRDEYDTLRMHMSKLDDTSINILEMRYVLKMSHKEIAQVTELSLENINKKITRAKAKIRNSYAEGCDNDG